MSYFTKLIRIQVKGDDMNSKLNFLIATAVSLLLCQQSLVYAQNFGVEIGTAGVENFDAGVLNLGFSISLPLHQKAFCELSYNHWQGEDGNYKYARDIQQSFIDWNYFGNSGVNLSIFYKIYGINKFAISIGAGLGRYQMIKLNQSNEKDYFYKQLFRFPQSSITSSPKFWQFMEKRSSTPAVCKSSQIGEYLMLVLSYHLLNNDIYSGLDINAA